MADIPIPRGKQFRTVGIEFDPTADESLIRSADGEELIPVALSSEIAVLRSYGYEVLDHSPESVNLERAAKGLPLLLDHTSSEHVGRLMNVTVSADRKVRGAMRFSRSARAQDVKRDVLDGIRTDLSVGYTLDDVIEKATRSGDDIPTYRMKWTPHEASLVAIPADFTVGVGRSADEAAATVVIPSLDPLPIPAPEARSTPVSESTPAAPVAAPIVVDRGAEIAELCELGGFPHRAAEMIRSNKSVADIKAELREAKAQAAKATIDNAPAPVVENYDEPGRSFDIGKAIRAALSGDWKEAGYERAVSLNEAKRLGKTTDGRSIFVPTVQKRTPQELEQRTTLKTATNNIGGYTVFSEYGGFIELLRNRTIVGRLGATMLPGLQGNVAFPRQITAGTAYWLAEASGSDVTESNVTFDQVTLSPKTLMGMQSYSNQLLAQGVVNIDALVRDDLSKILGLELDRAAIHGSGASNQPLGVFGISGVNSEAFGGTVTYAHLVAMVAAISADNADIGDVAFAVTPETAAKALQVARFSSTDTPLYQGTLQDGQMIGYRAAVSNQLSKVLGAGTNEHAILAGVWPQLLVGEWGSMQLTVDPYTKAGQDVVRIIARLFVDVDVRHAESFCIGTGLIP